MAKGLWLMAYGLWFKAIQRRRRGKMIFHGGGLRHIPYAWEFSMKLIDNRLLKTGELLHGAFDE